MAASTRDPKIDIIRGLAILIIVINHLTQSMRFYGLVGSEIPTPTTYGYSSAAELFVIVSGYMIGLVRVRKPGAIRKVLARAGELYAYNWLLLLGVLPFVYAMNGPEAVYWRADLLLAQPTTAIFSFGTLVYAPRLLDILHLYIILMLAAPAAILLHAKSPKLLVVASVATYLIGQVIKVMDAWEAMGVFHFNPLTWQILFFVPLVLGAQRAHVHLFGFFDGVGRWRWAAATAAIVILAAIAKVYSAHHYLPFYGTLMDRDNLGAARIVHACLMVTLYAGLLVAAQPIIQSAPFRFLAVIGRHSLNCFSLSVLATYAFAIGWAYLSQSYIGYLTSVALAVAITFAGATYWDKRQTRLA